MTIQTTGLHHVTAIAGNPRKNVEFYTEILGLRLVKKTVNFDDKFTYHFYYGDEVGHPGTILTFFPFEGARPGRIGRGQTSATAFVIPEDAIDYWLDRLESNDVAVETPQDRLNQTVIPCSDHDGQSLELVTGTNDIEPWGAGSIPETYAITGFHGVTIDSLDPGRTATVLETLGYEQIDRTANRTRFQTDRNRASVIDLLDRPEAPPGDQGVGTVHHIAFRTPDQQEQIEWRHKLSTIGLQVTPQKDRQYFTSIYFREPGGILFEIATDEPGFTLDESVDDLGTSLKLPSWLEDDREMLEEQLPEINTDTIVEMD